MWPAYCVSGLHCLYWCLFGIQYVMCSAFQVFIMRTTSYSKCRPINFSGVHFAGHFEFLVIIMWNIDCAVRPIISYHSFWCIYPKLYKHNVGVLNICMEEFFMRTTFRFWYSLCGLLVFQISVMLITVRFWYSAILYLDRFQHS